MPSRTLTIAHRIVRMLTATAGFAVAFMFAYVVSTGGEMLVDARIIRENTNDIPWKSIKGEEISRGVNAPSSTHIVFQMPENIPAVSREVLFGMQGRKTRYWGYCLPENEDPEVVKRRTGFPGLVFLSEAERAARAEAQRVRDERNKLTPLELPSPERVQQELLRSAAAKQETRIRHQLEFFSASMICYVMSEKSLPMGLDSDGDRLNDFLEKDIGSNTKIKDTDSDGVSDDTEYVTGTMPTLRDTDSDGLIDGIEDKNFNGNADPGETDPRVRDSDRDGLCDGLCRIRFKKQEYYIGEDQNLNGQVDNNETNPLLPDSDKDGIQDEEEILSCVLAGKTKCP